MIFFLFVFVLLAITRPVLLARHWWSVYISKSPNPREFCASHSSRRILGFVPFGCMVKFQFLAQFPVDHFSQPVVSTLLRQFAAFVLVINRFVSHHILQLWLVFHTSVSWWFFTAGRIRGYVPESESNNATGVRTRVLPQSIALTITPPRRLPNIY